MNRKSTAAKCFEFSYLLYVSGGEGDMLEMLDILEMLEVDGYWIGFVHGLFVSVISVILEHELEDREV